MSVKPALLLQLPMFLFLSVCASSLRRSVLVCSLALAPLLSTTCALAANNKGTPTRDLATQIDANPVNPWTKGVSKERQEKAEHFDREGTQLFERSRFEAAAEMYRKALRLWDHPSVHYNLALAQMNMGDPVAAYAQLEEALKYGGAPLEQDYQEEARTRLKKLGERISMIELSSREVGTTVTVDNEPISAIPSRKLLLPGVHKVDASKQGYEPRSYNVELAAGDTKRVDIHLYTTVQLTEVKRPMPFWVPIAVTGAGAGMVLTGAALGLRSNTLRERYDSHTGTNCSGATGCVLSKTPLNLRDDADTLRTWSAIAYVAGAVTIAGATVWLWFNKPRTRKFTPDERERQTTVAPIVTVNALGAMASGRF